MRVEIRHRNVGTWRRKHFIDLVVIFSEEERRIITIRGLQHVEIDLTPGILASSEFPLPPFAVTVMFFASPLFFLGGCVSAVIASGGFGVLIVIAAISLFAYSIYARIKLSRANITTISINSFFEDPRRPVLVPSADAALATTAFRRRFAILKQMIEESAQLSVEVLEL